MAFSTAAETSEYGTTMEKDGTVVEVRRFSKHPSLDKIELRWTDPSNKAAKFHMRDGKIVELRAADIKELPSMSAAALLELAAKASANSGDRPRIMTTPQ
jgi:hypothetical protein